MLVVRPIVATERDWLVQLHVDAGWDSPVVTPSGSHDPAQLAAFVATEHDSLLGALTYRLGPDGVEVVSLTCTVQGRGAGTSLLAAARELATARGLRLWLITTDDNEPARRFYERRGMRLVRTHSGFVETVRRVKPTATLTFTDALEFCAVDDSIVAVIS